MTESIHIVIVVCHFSKNVLVSDRLRFLISGLDDTGAPDLMY
jgi:hypothetical protein